MFVKFFVSYAREDFSHAACIRQFLQEELGLRVWMDTEELCAGEDYESVIMTNIGDSDFFVACLSSHSINNQGFIRKEHNKAFEVWNAKGKDSMFFIPVRLEDISLPENLHGIHRVDYFQQSWKEHLLRAIKKGSGKRLDEIQILESPTRASKAAKSDVKQMKRFLRIDPVAADALGIVECVQQLEEEKWDPDGCWIRTHRSLKVCGLQGAKWVEDDETYDRFRDCLDRLAPVPDASFKFLLINPTSPAIDKIKQKTRASSDVEHDERLLRKYYDLSQDFEEIFEVRLYDHFPYFRIVVVDENEMAVSRYNISKSRKEGWKASHLILKNDSHPGRPEASSLFYAFERYFDHVWRDLSHPIEEIVAKMANKTRDP